MMSIAYNYNFLIPLLTNVEFNKEHSCTLSKSTWWCCDLGGGGTAYTPASGFLGPGCSGDIRAFAAFTEHFPVSHLAIDFNSLQGTRVCISQTDFGVKEWPVGWGSLPEPLLLPFQRAGCSIELLKVSCSGYYCLTRNFPKGS